jgi:hypothetical protein
MNKINQTQWDKETVQYVINILRRGTTIWSGRKETFSRARKSVLIGKTLKGKDKFKYHWQAVIRGSIMINF